MCPFSRLLHEVMITDTKIITLPPTLLSPRGEIPSAVAEYCLWKHRRRRSLKAPALDECRRLEKPINMLLVVIDTLRMSRRSFFD